MKFCWLATLLCASILSGCVEKQPLTRPDDAANSPPVQRQAPVEPQEAIKSVAAMQDRLVRVAAPLLLKNQGSCRKLSRPLMGFTARNQYSYSPELAKEAHLALNLGDALQVGAIMPGSGAARSGLQRGDQLIAVEDEPMPQGANAEQEAPNVLAPLLADQDSITLTVQRNGKARKVNISPTQACAFRIELGNADNVNSYADGARIMVTRGMLHFTQSDTELAYVIARELAHNILLHPQQLKSAGTAAEIINALKPIFPQSGSENKTADLPPVPKEMDALADRLALNMLKRASINIDEVAAFWQRLAKQYPANASNAHTAIHRDTAYRIAAIEKTVAAIEAREKMTRSVPRRPKSKKRRR
ncbi:MAG: peptidase M48 [Oxalobacter sp.]|nr:MAG: peptidase M48 [Oxalobacter sp.]